MGAIFYSNWKKEEVIIFRFGGYMFKDKNILYIVHKYNSFQKDPIEEAAKYFNKVYVLVRYKPISSIVKYLPFKKLKAFDESVVIDLKGLPKNVEVIKTPVWYVPFGVFNKWLGELHFRAVDRAIKKYNIKFDIVHSHFIWSSGYVGMRLKEKYNVPFVVTGHGFDVYQLPFKNDWWKEKIREILLSANQIVTVSEFNRSFLSKIEIPDSKVKIINNGFSSKDFYLIDKITPRKQLNIDINKKVVIAVGNLEKIKGYDILIESMVKLVLENENILCYIVGEGSQHSNLESLIKQNKLENNVFLVGAKPHDTIMKWMNAGDIFVIPSRMESASVVLLEALACGKPVVSMKVGIVPDIIISDKYGYISENNSNSLAENIGKALRGDWNYNEIANYVNSFSWESSVRELTNIYDNIIDSSKE